MRIPQIQALRALAALLVIIYHAQWLPGGYVGVDIFYVISGYLITGLLLRECERSGGISFQVFYLRRIKRLLPTSFTVLIATAMMAWVIYPENLRKDLGQDIAAASLYLSNYFFAFWQLDYQNLNTVPPAVIHFWSLAVEEQFYLFWPVIIFILFKVGGRRGIGIGVAVITLSSFCFSLYLTSSSPIFSFYSLPSRAWELGVGALVIFIPRRIQISSRYAWLASALILYAAFKFNDSTLFPGTSALFPVLGTAIALASVRNWPPSLNFLSSNRFVQWLGDISYPLYLWHWPVLLLPSIYLGRDLSIGERLLSIAFTILLAGFTHRIIEEPLRRKDIAGKKIVSAAVGATLFSLLCALLISVSSSQSITLKNGEKIPLTSILAEPVIYRDGCHLSNGQIVPGKCEYGAKKSSRKIVIFGDSHAAQWFPALEKLASKHDFTLVSLTKSACPGPAVRKVDIGQYTNAECAQWREQVYQRISEINPEVVIVSGMQYFKMPSEYSSRTVWWQEGQRKTLNDLDNSGARIIYLADTPHPRKDIPSCLSAKEQELCNDSRSAPPIFVPGYERINPTPWLCTEESCPAVVDGVVAYRDASHISVAMSESLSEELEQALRSLGIRLK